MIALLSAFRDAPWIGPGRTRAWALMLIVLAAVLVLSLVIATRGGTAPDPEGRPLATDFTSFWTAARLALDGAPGAAWDPVAHAAIERARFSPASGYTADYYAFFYPPPFLLICLPLGLLPYGVALLVWLGLTGTAYFVTVRTLLPRSWPAALTALSFPAVLLNVEHGQNGTLSATLVGAAALQLDRRPTLAGACLGALCFKPQLALLVLPALIFSRRWRSLVGAAATAIALCAASLLVLGADAWRSFLAGAPLAAAALEAGSMGFQKMASPFSAVRVLGGAPLASWAVQATVSLAALGVLAAVAWRRPGGVAEMATLAAADCLATPFLLDYDLMLLSLPLAWVAATADRSGFLPWEKLVLAAGFMLPMVARPVAMTAGMPLAPLVVAALLAVTVRRAFSRRLDDSVQADAGTTVVLGGAGGIAASLGVTCQTFSCRTWPYTNAALGFLRHMTDFCRLETGPSVRCRQSNAGARFAKRKALVLRASGSHYAWQQTNPLLSLPQLSLRGAIATRQSCSSRV
jgi:alpha-1,2-mannosyltransferase